MFQYSGKSLFSQVNESLKVAFFAVSFIAAFVFQNPFHQAVLLAFLIALLFIARYRDFAKLFGSLIPFLLLADLSFFIFLSDTSLNLVQLTLSSNLRIFSLFAATAFFTFSTDIFALVRLMKRIHLPETLYLSIYILFRFLPELERDLYEIRSIQRIKGISPKQPVRYVKSVMIPLLFTALQKSDDIAVAYFLRQRREQ